MRPVSGAWSAIGSRPEHPHGAAGRPPVALERLDGRGLARPVRAEDDEDLAALGPQVQLVDRGGVPAGAVAHGEAALTLAGTGRLAWRRRLL